MTLFDLAAKITLDSSEYKKGLGEAKKSMSEYRSDVMNLSKVYEKEGMNRSDAMKRAYKEIDKSQYETSENAKKNAHKVSQEWKDAANKISGSVKGAIDTVKRIGVAVGGAAGAATIALGKIGFEYNSQMETYTTNFKVMLGSQEAAVAKVEELKKVAAATPFEMSDLAQATQTLLSFNVSSEESSKVMKQLGDISLGNKQKFETLTRAYGKMNAAQKVTLEDINMMIDSGFNPLLIVSENTGESMGDLYKRISEGKVSFEEIQAAIGQATAEGGQFFNGLKEGSETTAGLTSTLRDVVNTKAGEFFQGVSDKVKEALPNIISFVEGIDVGVVKEKLDGLMQTFIKITPIVAGAAVAAGAYKAAVAISGIIDAVKKATESQTIAQAALNAVMNANPFVLVATLIAGLTAAVTTLWFTNEDFRAAVVKAWNAIKDAAFSLYESVKDFFTVKIPNAFNTLLDAVSKLHDNIRDFFTVKIPNAFHELVSKAANWGSDVINNMLNGLKSAWEGVKSWFNNAWDSLFGNRTANVTVNRTENVTVNRQEAPAPSKGKRVNGSHANGLDYVPFNGYIAELHKGERVLTKKEADEYNRGRSGVTVNQYIYSEAKTAADLAQETLYQQERAVLLGV